MQRGIGALGETVARFDTVEASTVRFDDGTQQSTVEKEMDALQLGQLSNIS